MNAPPDNQQIAEMFAKRDRFRMAMEARRTPAERMEALYRLQAQSWAAMSAEGREGFIRQNISKRAVKTSR